MGGSSLFHTTAPTHHSSLVWSTASERKLTHARLHVAHMIDHLISCKPGQIHKPGRAATDSIGPGLAPPSLRYTLPSSLDLSRPSPRVLGLLVCYMLCPSEACIHISRSHSINRFLVTTVPPCLPPLRPALNNICPQGDRASFLLGEPPFT
ncbi:hypothetical protein BD289DRAFT_294833 [Coniella lustricola]|uniref:Uncharacterized protein n=1 Tax=Coniella lustricola TaxID=2025994 RepID=A0A2T3A4Y9_9PEZI|nr:hypothetical protein BD289DRAFT_294833 [Coniella lustricola]